MVSHRQTLTDIEIIGNVLIVVIALCQPRSELPVPILMWRLRCNIDIPYSLKHIILALGKESGLARAQLAGRSGGPTSSRSCTGVNIVI